jgi:DNA-binding winged helix-turn-helix (wHTH) protein/TolB-like protein/Flp pilus assembly protein TadD
MSERGGSQTAEPARFLDFGPFRLDRRERLLFRDATLLPLPPKAIELLLLLTEEPGRLRTKEELIEKVWPDVTVDESNLTQNIFLLRKALADDGGRWIATVPRRGYRFAGEVLPGIDPGQDAAAIQRRGAPAGRSLAILLAGVIVVAAVWLVWRLWPDRRPSNAAIRSIAVLPFQPVDGKAGDRILELGIADSLINKLSQLSDAVAVSPMHAVMPYLDGHADVLRAGRELGVDGVVEGNIQRVGQRVRCTVRLIRVANGSAVWADRYEDDAADVFEVEDRMAERIASALDIHIGPQQRRGLSRRYTNDRQAYDLYLQGRLSWERFDREGLEASIRYFNAALQRDPRYALAYAGLAKTYSVMYIYGPMDPREAGTRTKDAALRALAIDPQIAEAHVPLAASGIFQDWNWNLAEEEVQRALELDPSSDAHTLRGYVLQARGKPEEALVELRRERELDPLWRIAQNDCVLGLYYARRYDETIAEGLRQLALQPHNRLVRYVVGKAMLRKGRAAEAAAQQEANASESPDYQYSIGELAVLSAQRGDHAGFLKRIAQLEALRARDASRSLDYVLATVYAELGETDAAFKALDASFRVHFPFLWRVRVDPSFDSIRSDPRYAAVMSGLNLGSPPVH